MRTDAAIRRAAPIVAAIQALELTWLEAAVLLHGYLRCLDWPDVADELDVRLEDVEKARWTLVRKVAEALRQAEETPERLAS